MITYLWVENLHSWSLQRCVSIRLYEVPLSARDNAGSAFDGFLHAECQVRKGGPHSPVTVAFPPRKGIVLKREVD